MKNQFCDTPTIAILCSVLLSIAVTTLHAAERSDPPPQTTESEGPAGSPQGNQAKPDVPTGKTDEPGRASTGVPSNENKSAAEKSAPAENSPAKTQHIDSAVVRVETEASRQSNHLTKMDGSAFDVVPPDWYSESPDDPQLESIRVLGVDQQQLTQDFSREVASRIAARVDRLFGSGVHRYVNFSGEELEQLIVQNENRPGIWFNGENQESIEFQFALLKFDSAFEKLARKKWIEKRQQARLQQYGLVFAAMILLIGFSFFGLKLNSATHGHYQGRLQFLTTVVILGVVVAGIYFGSRLEWI